MGGWWGYSLWGAIAVANEAGQPSLQLNWQFVVTTELLAPVAAIQSCWHPLPSSAKLPAPVAIISKAASTCCCHQQSCRSNWQVISHPQTCWRLSSLLGIAIAGVVVHVQYVTESHIESIDEK